MHYARPTDTAYDGEIDDINASEDELSHLIEQVNTLLPSAAIQRKDVLFSWAGVRPLTNSPDNEMELRGYRFHDLTREGMPNVFNMTSSPILSHRLAGKCLSLAVKPKIKPSRKPQIISYNATIKPESEPSPALLNHWLDVSIADLRHAVEHEQPRTLEDLLFRRTGVSWTETLAREGARVAAESVADILKWSPDKIEKEVEHYLSFLFHRHGVGGK